MKRICLIPDKRMNSASKQRLLLLKKSLVWKGVCQSHGDKGRTHQNCRAQALAHGHTDLKRGTWRAGALSCTQGGPPALSHADILCVYLLLLGGTKVNLLVGIHDDPVWPHWYTDIILLFPFSWEPIHVAETQIDAGQTKRKGCAHTWAL